MQEPKLLFKNHHLKIHFNENDEKNWLENNDIIELIKLLKPYPSEEMDAYPISKLVNSPINDSPEIIKPVNAL
jgi:putative SOS response-associated peptidase YedK